MSDSFHGIVLPMRPIVHRINLPFISRAMMSRLMDDAIHYRITHVEVRVCHINLRAQDARAIGEFTILHALQQVEIFLYTAVSIGRLFPWLRKGAAIHAYFLRTLVIHIG